MDFYAPFNPQKANALQQGDVLFPVPFTGFRISQAPLVAKGSKEPVPADLRKSESLPAESQLAVQVTMSVGLVTNQSCDLSPDRGRPILVARVVSLPERIKKITSGTVGELANPGKRPSLFYLPPASNADFKLPASVVDLLEVVTFPPSEHAHLAEIVRLRLSADALNALQERFAYCFGRYAARDDLYS